MDTKPITIETVIRFAKQRRIRALSVGIIMLATLAAFQVKQQTSESRLCELYPNAKLTEGELYRLEFALIREGLEEFEQVLLRADILVQSKLLDDLTQLERLVRPLEG